MDRPCLGQQLRGGGPLGGILGQAALDQRPDLDRQVVKVRRVEYHAVDQRGGGPGAERPFAGGGEGEDRAQAEDVAGRPDFSAFGLFG
jgi:hypothetical protein